jgi:hypothetical protein
MINISIARLGLTLTLMLTTVVAHSATAQFKYQADNFRYSSKNPVRPELSLTTTDDSINLSFNVPEIPLFNHGRYYEYTPENVTLDIGHYPITSSRYKKYTFTEKTVKIKIIDDRITNYEIRISAQDDKWTNAEIDGTQIDLRINGYTKGTCDFLTCFPPHINTVWAAQVHVTINNCQSIRIWNDNHLCNAYHEEYDARSVTTADNAWEDLPHPQPERPKL